MSKTKVSLFSGNFIKVFFASLLMFTAFYFLLPTLPLYLTRELNIDESKTGIVLAVYTLAALLIRPFTGYFIDRYGRRTFYIPSVLFFSLFFLSYPLAGIFVIILIVRFIHGMFWGIATTTGSTLIVDIIPANRRGEGIGLYGLAMTIPMALGPFLGIQLTEGHDFVRMFMVAGILAFAGFLLTLTVRYPAIVLSERKKLAWRNLFESSSLPVTLNLLLVNISYGGLVSFISLYAIRTGIGNTGLFFVIFAAGIALARLYMGKIFDRNGPKALAISGLLLLITGNVMLGLIINRYGFLVSGFLLGIGSGIIFPTFQSMVNNLAPVHRRGAANSTLFSGLDLGIGLGMLITGFLAQKIGLPHTYIIFGILNGLALVFFIQVSLSHYKKTLPAKQSFES